MEQPSIDLLHRARLLRIRVKRSLRGTKWGSYRTTRVASSGLEFDALRDYQQGDDIRAIDWKSSARTTKLIVRSYEENRNRTIILVIDATGSMRCGSGKMLKETVAQELAVMIAYAAEYSGDALGVMIVSGEGAGKITWIPPRTGKQHVIALVERLLMIESAGSVDDWRTIGRDIIMNIKRDALVIVLGDGIGRYFMKSLQEIARKNIVIFGCIRDSVEENFSHHLGLITYDPEFDVRAAITTRSERLHIQKYIQSWYDRQAQEARLARVHYVNLLLQDAYEDTLLRFLHNGVI